MLGEHEMALDFVSPKRILQLADEIGDKLSARWYSRPLAVKLAMADCCFLHRLIQVARRHGLFEVAKRRGLSISGLDPTGE